MHMATELKTDKQNSGSRTSSRFWLVKFAPFRTDWSEVIRRGIFTMRGVRSPEARNNLRAMHLGDQVLFYRSQRDPAVMGLMEVIRPAYPDPTSVDPQWLTCDFRPIRTLPEPIPLAKIKNHPDLADLPLIRRPRLAVMPLTPAQFNSIHTLC